jgi:MATE family multidrug resistance protein
LSQTPERLYSLSASDSRGRSPDCEGKTPISRPVESTEPRGTVRVDLRAMVPLVVPLMVSNGVQIVLNLVDLWFLGRISTKAVAAAGAVQPLAALFILVLGGGGMAVQSVVAYSYGARQYARASNAVWTAFWVALCAVPLSVLMAVSGRAVMAAFGVPYQIQTLAAEFWFPRVVGAPVAVATGALFSYFNGIGHPRMSLVMTSTVVFANTLLNEIFIFQFGWGIAGSGWATNVAQALGLVLSLLVFFSVDYRRKYKSHRTWRPHLNRLWRQWRIGFLMSVMPATEILGSSMFQMMQVRLGPEAGAATQLAVVLPSVGYIACFAIASAGATLVGHALGAGDRGRAMRLGSRAILLSTLCSGGAAVILAHSAHWLIPLFIEGNDYSSESVIALTSRLLWLVAAYQLFDGLAFSSAMCLRAIGDAAVPAGLTLLLPWVVFLPLAHSFTFPPNGGWVDFLPQFGWGAVGGMVAAVIYVMLLASALSLRWYWLMVKGGTPPALTRV